MTCASCVARVERALKKVPGVDGATVNLATEKATVSYDPAQSPVGALLGAIENAGYEPRRETLVFDVAGGHVHNPDALQMALLAVPGVVSADRVGRWRLGHRHLPDRRRRRAAAARRGRNRWVSS